MADETKKEETKEADKVDVNKAIADMQKTIADLQAKLEAKKQDDKSDPILSKIKQETDDKEKEAKKQKDTEAAVAFSLMGDLFQKENKDILPSETSKIFEAAKNEKYENKIQQSNAIKSALVQSFFRLQDNVDMLTDNQKEKLQDFLKLTKDAKEQDAAFIYSEIMEPTLLTLKRIKKAEQIAKINANGGEISDEMKAYEKKLSENSEKHFFKKG
jgi:hypothetical protein